MTETPLKPPWWCVLVNLLRYRQWSTCPHGTWVRKEVATVHRRGNRPATKLAETVYQCQGCRVLDHAPRPLA